MAPPPMPVMTDLHRLDPEAAGGYGGKAAGLARLIAGGAAVPVGFAVAAQATPFKDWPAEDRAEYARRCADLLTTGPIVVRSSAIGEDSAGRSFAGLFETVLGVTSLSAAEDAAARCLDSSRAPRVRAYAGARAPAMGLVVQGQVEARDAGVCFTVDPTGREAAVLVEAVLGSGDALVSGRTEPERWRVYGNDRGGFEARREAGGAAGVLTAETAADIAGQAAAIAAGQGHPLDLEWARDAQGRLLWLQARPITAVHPVTPPLIERFHDGVDDGPVTVWANWNLREVMPNPLTPLAGGLWKEEILPVIAEPVFGLPRSSRLFVQVVPLDLVNRRFRWNMNAMYGVPLFGIALPRLLRLMDPEAAAVTARLIADGILTKRRLRGSWSLPLHVLVASVRSAWGMRQGLYPRSVLELFERSGEAVAARPALDELTDAQLVDELRIFRSPAFAPLRDGMSAVSVGIFVLGAAEVLFRGHPEARGRLASGVSGNPTTAISVAIDDLADVARPLHAVFAPPRPWPELRDELVQSAPGRAWLTALDAFLARFGQRCPGEFDITVPRWAEDPSLIVGLVRAELAHPAPEGVKARLERLGREREVAVERAAASAAYWRRPLMRFFARRLLDYLPLREAPKHAAMFFFQRVREAALEAGRRLVDRGALGAAGDVFFVEWPELRGMLAGGAVPSGLAKTVSARRETFARASAAATPDFLRSDGVPVERSEAPCPPGTLRGVAASRGRARGRARILRQPEADALRESDVLVVEFADPGWTPLFPRAAAVVMEVGGVMCHAAVIAREMGIPAVMGAAGATTALRDGQWIEVDGETGTVTYDVTGRA